MIDLRALSVRSAFAVVGVSRAGRGGDRHASATLVREGVIVTAAHNVPTAADSAPQVVRIRFADQHEEEGTVTGVSEGLDLAVISVDTGAVTPLDWGAGEELDAGTEIAAIAAPGGRPRLTPGVVAAVDSRLRTRSGSPVDGVFEHTAPLIRGASGGPVLDDKGKVVGLNINRLEGGLYQAVAVDDALRSAIDRLAEGGRVGQPRLGVTITPDRKARRMRDAVGLPPVAGVLIAAVADDSPAATAGLERGDLVIEVDGKPVREADDLLLALRRSDPQLSLTVIHGGTERRDVSVTLES